MTHKVLPMMRLNLELSDPNATEAANVAFEEQYT